MTDKLTISSGQQQLINFDISINGMIAEAPRVRFVITNVFGGNLYFECARDIENRKQWSVELPALTCLSENAADHQYSVQVIADDFYFEPITGLLEVVKHNKGDVVVESIAVDGEVLQEAPSEPPSVIVSEDARESIECPTKVGKKQVSSDITATAPMKPVVESASEIAEKIIAETMGGKVKKPERKGFLLTKKPVDLEVENKKQENSKKVKDILSNKS